MNVCIMLPNWIGDVVMATPALRAIKSRFGEQAHIVGLMRPYVSKVLEGTDWLDEHLYYDGKKRGAWLRMASTAGELRRRKIDLCVSLPNSLSSGVIAWLGGARERVGFARHGRGLLLTKKLHAPRTGRKFTPRSAVEHYVELAEAIGCPVASRRLELATLPADEAGADLVWRNLGLDDGRQVVALNTGSANSSARHWPGEYFAQLAAQAARELNVSVLVVCGPGERAAAAEIARWAAHPRVLSMADQDMGLGVSKAVIRRSSLMVTTDSGPRHIAKAFGVPLVSLCGPIDPRWTATEFPPETQLFVDLPCRPCGKAKCPLVHHRCMRDLSVDRVFAAVAERLKSGGVKEAA